MPSAAGMSMWPSPRYSSGSMRPGTLPGLLGLSPSKVSSVATFGSCPGAVVSAARPMFAGRAVDSMRSRTVSGVGSSRSP
jgi:hypothetical protein